MGDTYGPILGSVQLRGVRCPRAATQEVGQSTLLLADVSVQVDLRAVAEQDDLEGGVDFAALASVVKEAVAAEARELLEAAAVSVADAVLGRFPSVAEVWLRLAKPNPPGLDAAEEAVELRLTRPVLTRDS